MIELSGDTSKLVQAAKRFKEALTQLNRIQSMDKLIQVLADDRIKLGTDYAIVRKYNEVRIVCHRVYVANICEAAEKCGVQIAQIFTFDYGDLTNWMNPK